MSEPIREEIKIAVTPMAVPENWLGGALRQLKELDHAVDQINQKFAHGFSVPALRGLEALKEEIRRLQTPLGGLNLEKLAGGLGFSEHLAELRKFAAERRDLIKELRGGEFRGTPSAATFFSGFEQHLLARQQGQISALKQLLTPSVTAGATPAGAALAGLQALTVQTPLVHLTAGTVTVAGGAAGVATPAGAAAAAGGGGGGGGGRGSKGAAAIAAELRHRASLEEEKFRADRATLARDDYSAIAALLEQKATQLQALLARSEFQHEARTVQRARETITQRIETYGQQALDLRNRAAFRAMSGTPGPPSVVTGPGGGLFTLLPQDADLGLSAVGPHATSSAGLTQTLQANRAKWQAHQAAVRAQQLATMQQAAASAGINVAGMSPAALAMLASMNLGTAPAPFSPPVIPPPVIPKPGQMAPGYFSQLGNKFIGLTQYAVAASALYQGANLAGYAGGRAVDIEAQEKRLSQVYTGQGGTTRQLTDDVLKLASAHGRETKEAMEAAVQWARLGMSRVEINQAVETSLKAANVAEISAADATKHLSSVMVTYHLNASQLNDVLGMMNDSSNKLNVTNKDLFEGLNRSAASAKQFGLGLPELQGSIAALVSQGQTGSQAGNFLKTLFTRMNDPDKQALLRRFGIESTTNVGHDLRTGPERLQQLFEGYQKLGPKDRQELLGDLVGATQANRAAVFMDNYIKSLDRAADSQRNLNSADIENAKILDSVRAQWRSLTAEFDRFVSTAANAGRGGITPLSLLSGGLRGATNILSMGDDVLGGSNSTVSRALRMIVDPKSALLTGGRALDNPALPQPARDALINYLLGPFGAANYLAGQTPSGMVSSLGQSSRTAFAGARADRIDQMKFATLARTFGSMNPETQAGYLKQYGMEGMSTPAAVAEFQKRSSEAGVRAAKEQAEAEQQHASALGIINAQLAKGNLTQAEQNRLLTERNDLQNKWREFKLQSDTQDDEGFYVNAQKTADILGQMEERLHAIGQAFHQLPQAADDFGAKLEQHVDLLKQEEQALVDARAALAAAGQAHSDQYAELTDRIQNVRGRIQGAEGFRSVAQLMSDRAIAFGNARNEGESFAVGFTPGEQLLAQRKKLEEELKTLRERGGNLGDNDAARGLQLQIQLEETREGIQKRIFQLKKEEQQLIIEGRKEFERSLLTAGPGALLQKMAAFNGRNTGIGGFFAMSPELRRDVLLLNGGEAIQRNRREQNILNNEGRTVAQQQQEAARLREEMQKWREILQRNTGTVAAGGQVAAATAETARGAAMLAVFNNQVQRAAPLIGAMADAIEAAVVRIVAISARPGTRDGFDLPAGRGFAAGAA